MKLTVKSLHDALGAVLEIDPEAKYRFVNHGSDTYTLDFEIDPSRVNEEVFQTLRAHEVVEECDEEDSHENRVRELSIILDDEYEARLDEHYARTGRK